MNKKEFIKSKVDSIEWDEQNIVKDRQGILGGMVEVKIYGKSCYHQYWQHIGTIDYDIVNGEFGEVQPLVCGKDKYYYYNRDKMKYYKTYPEAENYSKNQYIKSVKLKANWQYKTEKNNGR